MALDVWLSHFLWIAFEKSVPFRLLKVFQKIRGYAVIDDLGKHFNCYSKWFSARLFGSVFSSSSDHFTGKNAWRILVCWAAFVILLATGGVIWFVIPPAQRNFVRWVLMILSSPSRRPTVWVYTICVWACIIIFRSTFFLYFIPKFIVPFSLSYFFCGFQGHEVVHLSFIFEFYGCNAAGLTLPAL